MLPQPLLRFLLADEPGTGKTMMAGLYLREMQRLGLVKRAIIVCPANLCSKWVADFQRFFGGGLRHLTANTVREDAVAAAAPVRRPHPDRPRLRRGRGGGRGLARPPR